jgi:16S rRNA G966 N2-methylase RsmD
MNVSSFKGVNVERDLKRIAKTLFKIRHWKIIEGSYEDIENIEATWFIDPPYQFGGEHYKESSKNLNFSKLAEWCKSRNGQIIVCENTKANWMEFKPMVNMTGTTYTTTEAIWSNHKTNYDAVQQSLQF